MVGGCCDCWIFRNIKDYEGTITVTPLLPLNWYAGCSFPLASVFPPQMPYPVVEAQWPKSVSIDYLELRSVWSTVLAPTEVRTL